MSTLATPTRISLTEEEVFEAIQEYFKKKHSKLAEEEFELKIVYDGYQHICTAYITIIDLQ